MSMGPPCADETATTPCHPGHPNGDSKGEKQRAYYKLMIARNINKRVENTSVDNQSMKISAVKGFLLLCKKIEPGFCKDT